MFTLMKAIITTIAAITLTVSPQSGKAPVEVKAVVAIQGPAAGSVCLTVSPDTEPTAHILLGCKNINVNGSETINIAFESTGGATGHTYTFNGVFVPEEGEVVTSNGVVVKVE